MSPLRAACLGTFVGLLAAGGAALAAPRARTEATQGPDPSSADRDGPALEHARDQAIRTARALFLRRCAHCHGADARGDEGPDLHDLPISDRRIATVVARGIKGEMPSFARQFDRAALVDLVAYLRSLGD